MEWLSTCHIDGIIIGICTFLIIGMFHPIVIKAEYYFGTRCWWWFLVLGIAGIIASIWSFRIFILLDNQRNIRPTQTCAERMVPDEPETETGIRRKLRIENYQVLTDALSAHFQFSIFNFQFHKYSCKGNSPFNAPNAFIAKAPISSSPGMTTIRANPSIHSRNKEITYALFAIPPVKIMASV